VRERKAGVADGEVLKIYPGQDGVARVVRVRTADREVTHPMQQHCHMKVPRLEELMKTDSDCSDSLLYI